MSIPPLVCNTPPPPDQCEEDKEDFDIHYSLSQEDDDESEFDFQGFTFNQLQSNATVSKSEQIQDACENLRENKCDNQKIDSDNNQPEINVVEEINVEDLNLSVQEDESALAQTTHSIDTEKELKDTEIEIEQGSQSNAVNEIVYDNLNTGEIENSVLEKPSLYVDDTNIPDHIPSLPDVDNHNDEEIKTQFNTDLSEGSNLPSISSTVLDQKNDEVNMTPQINEAIDDDFGDFEDFQVSHTSTTVIENCDNPWASEQVEQDTGFSEFKANFDSNVTDIPVEVAHSSSQNKINTIEKDDDDFGDFDEFKSSNVGNNDAPENAQDTFVSGIEMLNLQATGVENNLLENVNRVFHSIFESEAPISDIELANNLDSSLGETWRHLLDTDERQPYIVAWNNSSGQKSLLKALCIDSRNILFAPKWNANMPKFAANLGNAPLQPQKQLSSTAGAISNEIADKTINKSPASWADPFTADGQESCNTDKASTVRESRPAEMEMFPPVMPSNPNKIFSSTLNIQPMRQISLPDTHIFTPTDSETPRSKTIHYDSTPPILLPKSSNSQPSSLPIEKEAVKDQDEWEFQDFKGATVPSCSLKENVPITSTSSLPAPTNATLESQMLQPVKLDLLMPTLNWPDPGEVKETFDDFSDFISKTPSSDINNVTANVATDGEESVPASVYTEANQEFYPKVVPTNTSVTVLTDTHIATMPTIETDFHDDEFDTFQSALPPTKTKTSVNPTPDPEYGFFNNSNHNISMENTRPNNALKPNLSLFEMKENSFETSFQTQPKSLPMQTTEMPMIPSILQPTVANSTQKTGQILQPLSLESYSQINWPNPGIDLQDLSRFNPVDTLQSLKSDLSSGSQSKSGSPAHSNKVVQNQSEDDVWGEFVSSKPKQSMPPNPQVNDDDEWSDFICSPAVKPLNGLNTISFNVHSNTNLQKPGIVNNKLSKNSETSFDIPTLNYITPKSGSSKTYNIDRHLQRL